MMAQTQNPPLVLLHAYLADHALWDLTRLALGKQTRVIAPDFPGFGNTPVLSAEPSIDALADEVVKELRAQNVTRAVFAGMSMGGYVALSLAERYPEMVAGLGLISSQVDPDGPGMRRLRHTIITAVHSHGPAAATQALLEKSFSSKFRNRAEITRLAVQCASTASPEGICWALAAMGSRLDRTETLKKLRVPLLIIHGAEDCVASVKGAREMAKLNPRARFLEVPEGGHAVPWESPALVAEALDQLMVRSQSAGLR